MKKPSSKIRNEIARLQEQLKLAETREAERIGRIALKAGLGDIEIDEGELQATFEDLTRRFRESKSASIGKQRGGSVIASQQTALVPAGADAGGNGEA